MGGAWEDPNNWKDDHGMQRTPTESDDVAIAGLNPNAGVAVNASDWCRTLFTDGSSGVEIHGGSLICTNPSDLNGPITLNGMLWMQSGTTVNNTFTWAGGMLTLGNNETGAGPVTFTAPIQIVGSDDKFLEAGTLVNTAGITQTGTGKLDLTNQTLKNEATYDLESDADIQNGRIQNDGVFQKSAGAGMSTITGEFDNSSSGQIAVASGTVRLANVGTWTGAAMLVLPDCHLLLDGSNSTVTVPFETL
jgi:hypothetical protein